MVLSIARAPLFKREPSFIVFRACSGGCGVPVLDDGGCWDGHTAAASAPHFCRGKAGRLKVVICFWRLPECWWPQTALVTELIFGKPWGPISRTILDLYLLSL